MIVADDKIVRFSYSISDEQGQLLESNQGEKAVAYLHGHDNMMPGVEAMLEGKAAGETVEALLPAAQTFGDRQDGLEQRVPVKHLQGATKWQAGMTALVHTEQGPRQVTVLKVGKFMANVDMNYPLSGKTLKFNITILDVRDASDEEIAHGHAHGDGGHQH
ncbi:peptidylprolyl isomerase [Shewanella sp. NIFS-20-20]|uniref:FKBP-type peptidyl-prolyl cis-trans isomerase n=1 Tax=Shewanella sp. NIFS-20-20 TaxID=2853806 RepID=UPI001C46BDEF|nr:FKBP-type peptidyl-prolyl cis-trans isomerase [Shewanella sp. NIFS-20-20]MBV7314330.1 FKBP-type peptidyl-prolyl cis-trans isomerase [Shewanella sp. NIFS-20-20]